MKLIILFALILSLTLPGIGQELNSKITSSNAGSMENSYNQLTWSIGESVLLVPEEEAFGSLKKSDSNLKFSNNEKLISALSLEIYPNPTIDDIFIRYSKNIKLSGSIKIYDVNGRCLKNLEHKDLIPYGYKISLQEYKSGIYFLEVANLKFKIIKN